jgi:hypothetical protein
MPLTAPIAKGRFVGAAIKLPKSLLLGGPPKVDY